MNKIYKIIATTIIVTSILYFSFAELILFLSKYLPLQADLGFYTLKETISIPGILMLGEIVALISIVYFSQNENNTYKPHGKTTNTSVNRRRLFSRVINHPRKTMTRAKRRCG
jgi:hypothetical protein